MLVIAYYYSSCVFGFLFFVSDYTVGNSLRAWAQFDTDFLSEIREWKFEPDEMQRRFNEDMLKDEYYDHKDLKLGSSDFEIIAKIHNYLNLRINLLAFVKSPRLWRVALHGGVDHTRTFRSLRLLPNVQFVYASNATIEIDTFRDYLKSLIKKRRSFWNKGRYCISVELEDSSLKKEDLQKILNEIDQKRIHFRIETTSNTRFWLVTINDK